MTLRKTSSKKKSITFRLSSEELAEISANVDVSGLNISSFVRKCVMGKRIVSKIDLKVLNELRRLGGLIKHLFNETNGLYRQETSALLDELNAAVVRIGRKREEDKEEE